MFSWVLVVVVIAAAIYWFTRGNGASGWSRSDDAERILRERFARGDIDDEAYRQRLAELRRSQSGGP